MELKYRFVDYVDQFEKGMLVSRTDAAMLFGVGRSTARYHLERAVKAGLLNKVYGWTGRQSGWLYALPETMPMLEGFNG